MKPYSFFRIPITLMLILSLLVRVPGYGQKAVLPTLEKGLICSAMKLCNQLPIPGPTGVELKQFCTSALLNLYDRSLLCRSTIKSEINYVMKDSQNSGKVPYPLLSRENELCGTSYLPERVKEIPEFKPKSGFIRRPDHIIVKDGSQPPYQANIRFVVEVKFPGDSLNEEVENDYVNIAGSKEKFALLTLDKCQDMKEDEENTVFLPLLKPLFNQLHQTKVAEKPRPAVAEAQVPSTFDKVLDKLENSGAGLLAAGLLLIVMLDMAPQDDHFIAPLQEIVETKWGVNLNFLH